MLLLSRFLPQFFFIITSITEITSLRCLSCQYHSDMPKEYQLCHAIVQKCNPSLNETFCTSVNFTINGRTGIRKGCTGLILCSNTTQLCKSSIEEKGYSSCDIVCCNHEICNTDNMVTTSPTASTRSYQPTIFDDILSTTTIDNRCNRFSGDLSFLSFLLSVTYVTILHNE